MNVAWYNSLLSAVQLFDKKKHKTKHKTIFSTILHKTITECINLMMFLVRLNIYNLKIFVPNN